MTDPTRLCKSRDYPPQQNCKVWLKLGSQTEEQDCMSTYTLQQVSQACYLRHGLIFGLDPLWRRSCFSSTATHFNSKSWKKRSGFFLLRHWIDENWTDVVTWNVTSMIFERKFKLRYSGMANYNYNNSESCVNCSFYHTKCFRGWYLFKRLKMLSVPTDEKCHVAHFAYLLIK